jgi:hypothetical protein
MRLVLTAVCATALTLTAAEQALPPRPVRPALAKFLTATLQFSASDLEELARGRTVARTLATNDTREVAVAGATWFSTSVNTYLAKLHDIVKLKATKEVLQISPFAPRASASDMQSMTLDPEDIDDLRRCRVGNCKLKLDAAALERFQRDVRWSDPSAAETANRVAREIVAGYVAAYQQGGAPALPQYRDRDRAVHVADETRVLFDRFSILAERFPDLRRHLDAYPQGRAGNAEDLFYWSKESWGLKPVISATHLTLWKTTSDVADAIVTSKQIYATHYFDASLAVTFLTGSGNPDEPGMYVVYMNRSVVDALGGMFGLIKRTIARSKARNGLVDQLQGLKKRVESK